MNLDIAWTYQSVAEGTLEYCLWVAMYSSRVHMATELALAENTYQMFDTTA